MTYGLHPPSADCPLCPRLVDFRLENRGKYPAFHNAPVPAFGGLDAELLVVGLAPGLKGANATGRPFTGDYAGEILYPALQKQGLAQGNYQPHAEDGHIEDRFTLLRTRITNAVRCVPPENKPTTDEIKLCNGFLAQEIASMPNLRVILSLGSISHHAVLRAYGEKLSAHKFAHAATHTLPSGILLVDSYHTSRYNINTGVLTVEMFDAIISHVKKLLHKTL